VSPPHWREAELRNRSHVVELVGEPRLVGDHVSAIELGAFDNWESAAPALEPDIERVRKKVAELKAEGRDPIEALAERLKLSRFRIEANEAPPSPRPPLVFKITDEGPKRPRIAASGEDLRADLSECTDDELWSLLNALEWHRPPPLEQPSLYMLLAGSSCRPCGAVLYRGDVILTVPLDMGPRGNPFLTYPECMTCARPRLLKAAETWEADWSIWRARVSSVEKILESRRGMP
jgi:hypothetical protein